MTLYYARVYKPTLLAAMQEKFGLQYEITGATAGVNATGGKSHWLYMIYSG